MSQRMPDYEDLRARQARAQESIVTYEVPCNCGNDGCMETIDPTDDYEGDDR